MPKVNPKGTPNAIVDGISGDVTRVVHLRSLNDGLFQVDFYIQGTHPVADMFALGQTVAITFDLGEPPPPPDDGLGIEMAQNIPPMIQGATAGGRVKAHGGGGFTVYESEEPQPDPNDLPVNVATPGFPSQSLEKTREILGLMPLPEPDGQVHVATMRRSDNE